VAADQEVGDRRCHGDRVEVEGEATRVEAGGEVTHLHGEEGRRKWGREMHVQKEVKRRK
jgi:hypothetical protein